MMAVLDPGDEAIFLDPYFVMYKHWSRWLVAIGHRRQLSRLPLPRRRVESAINAANEVADAQQPE